MQPATPSTPPPPALFAFDEGVALQLNASPGWRRGAGDILIEQPTLGVVVRWVYWASSGAFRYDQILRAEKLGAVFLPVMDGKVGLLKLWRPQARDQDAYEKQFPQFDLADVGRESWEAPRGFRVPGTSIEQTARFEAEAETGGRLVYQQGLRPGCDNTAFSPHLTHLSFGAIDLSRRVQEADPLEAILGRLTFYSLAELTDLENAGLYYCNYTATVIERILRRHPGFLR